MEGNKNNQIEEAGFMGNSCLEGAVYLFLKKDRHFFNFPQENL